MEAEGRKKARRAGEGVKGEVEVSEVEGKAEQYTMRRSRWCVIVRGEVCAGKVRRAVA